MTTSSNTVSKTLFKKLTIVLLFFLFTGCVSKEDAKIHNQDHQVNVSSAVPVKETVQQAKLHLNGNVSNIPFETSNNDENLVVSFIDFLKQNSIDSTYDESDNTIKFSIENNSVSISLGNNYINLNNVYLPIESSLIKKDSIYADNLFLKQLFNVSISKDNKDFNITYPDKLQIDYKKMKAKQPSEETKKLWEKVIDGYDFINTIKPLETILKSNPHDVLAQRLLAEDYESTAKLNAAYIKDDPNHKVESERRRLIAARLYELSNNYDPSLKIEMVDFGESETKRISDLVKTLRNYNKSIVPEDRVRILILYGKPDQETTTKLDGNTYTTYFYANKGKLYKFKNNKIISETSSR